MTEDEKRDKYYKKTYGISLWAYNLMLEAQGGVCAICKNPPKTRRLAVDHCHRWRYVKIRTEKREDGWWWATTYYVGNLTVPGKTRNKAIQAARSIMQTRSVRGLLCPFCNTGLRKFTHDPDRLGAAKEYLFRHQEGDYAKDSSILELAAASSPSGNRVLCG